MMASVNIVFKTQFKNFIISWKSHILFELLIIFYLSLIKHGGTVNAGNTKRYNF